jgi:hypothetical protein
MIETLRRWRRSVRAALVMVTVGILIATSAVALWQRDQVRDQLEAARRSAERLLPWLGEGGDGEGPSAHGGGAGEDRDDDRRTGAERVALLEEMSRLLAALAAEAPEVEEARQRLELTALLWRARAAAAPAQQDAAAPAAADEALAAAVALARRMEKADAPSSWPVLQRAYLLAAAAAMRRADELEARAWIDRALELGERRMAATPSAAAAAALARALAQLAELERSAGGLERSEQQWRRALAMLQRHLQRGEAGEDADGVDGETLLRLEMARALASLGDLEMQRQRRAGARGYYDRAWASAAEVSEHEDRANAAGRRMRRRTLIDVGLRRLRHGLAEGDQCAVILREQAALLILDDGEPDAGAEPVLDPWRGLDALLDLCPRFAERDRAMASWLGVQLAELAAAGPHAAALARLRRAAGDDAPLDDRSSP